MLIQSKPLITTLVIFFTSTAVAITGLVISNSGKIPSPENLENVSLEDLSEDLIINTQEIIPTKKPKTIVTKRWWKRLNVSVTAEREAELNILRQRLCGLYSFLGNKETASSTKDTCSESIDT